MDQNLGSLVKSCGFVDDEEWSESNYIDALLTVVIKINVGSDNLVKLD